MSGSQRLPAVSVRNPETAWAVCAVEFGMRSSSCAQPGQGGCTESQQLCAAKSSPGLLWGLRGDVTLFPCPRCLLSPCWIHVLQLFSLNTPALHGCTRTQAMAETGNSHSYIFLLNLQSCFTALPPMTFVLFFPSVLLTALLIQMDAINRFQRTGSCLRSNQNTQPS